jgi:O-antigen ligase
LASFVAGTLIRFIYGGRVFISEKLDSFSQLTNRNVLLKFNEFFSEEVIHPTYFSVFLIIALCICVFLAFNSGSLLKKITFVIGAICSIAFLLLLTTKMPIAALGIITIIVPTIYLIKNFSKRRLFYYVSSIFLISAIGSKVLKGVPNRALQEVYNYYNYFKGNDLKNYYSYDDLSIEYDTFWWEKTNRIVIWRNSLELMSLSPIIGFGTGDVQDDLTEMYKKNKELWRMQFFNTHNQYLDYQLRYGVLGTALLVFSLSFYFNKAYRGSDYLYLSFILLFTLCFLSENLMQREWGILCFAFFNSFLYYRMDLRDGSLL